jgi:diguanylate cyclase (GGDEF)-like protein/PAS domain S-box-containing protein
MPKGLDAEERLRLVARAAHHAEWQWDLFTDTIKWNGALEPVFGHPAHDLTTDVSWWQHRVHQEDESRVESSIRDAIDVGASTWADEYRFLYAAGGYASVLDRGFIVRDEDGRALRMHGTMQDLTVGRAGEAPRSREHLYASRFDQSLDGHLLMALDGQVLVANPAACRLLQRSEQEVCSLRPEDLLGEDAQRLSTLLEECGRRGQSHGLVTLTRIDGSRFAGEARMSLFHDALNRARARVTIRAVPEQTAAGSATARLAAIVDSSAEAIIGHSLDATIESWNRSAERLYGYSAAEAIGKPTSLIVPAERPQEVSRFLERLGNGEAIEPHDSVLIHKDGSRVPVSLTISPILDDTGQVVGHASISRDMTERNRAEADLRASESRFRALLAAAPVGMFESQPPRGCTYVNPAMTALTGLTEEQSLGTGWTQAIHAEDMIPLGEGWQRAFVTGEPFTVQTRIVRPNGDQRTAECSIAPLREVDGIITRWVGTVIDITERVAAEALLQYQASHDPLTSLPNRTRIQEELQRLTAADAAEPGTPFAVLLLDLDRFKEVNDTFGHVTGDLLLKQVGQRLQTEVRGRDTLARLGGDEFAVLLPGADGAIARSVADRLLRALERPFDVEGSGLEIGGSIGIALYPEHGVEPQALMRHVDVAMYAAKAGGLGAALYAPQSDHHSRDRLALLSDLRRAIQLDQLVLHYQPQIDVETGALSAVEALVRWSHPQHGLIPPDVFIPVAEQSRLIQPLSRWVLRAALAQCAAWRENGLDVPVSVNLSAQDLQDPALPETVVAVLANHALPPDRLRIEITETTLMADPRHAREILGRLREYGVQVAIDDFGTGYSSLAYLQRLPLNELKIDRSFVRDMAVDEGARAIVRAVTNLADDLGLRVVAEGVEDGATLEALRALGCDVAQGYYFARPLPAAEIAAWAGRHATSQAMLISRPAQVGGT